MKRLLNLVWLLLLALPLSATTYYVDNCVTVGSDSNNGTAPSTPWLTVAHANATATTGDTVNFRASCRWQETIDPTANTITYQAYGSGAQPIITGANYATWTQGAGQTQETCTGSCIFSSGFETASFADWTSKSNAGTASVTQTSGATAHGTLGLLITGDNSDTTYVYKNLTALSVNTSYYVRFYVNMAGDASTSNDNLVLLSNGYTTEVSVGVQQSAGSAYVSLVGGTGNFGGTMCSYSLAHGWNYNGWNYVDVLYTVSATVGAGQIWVNGTSECSATGLNTSGATVINRMFVGVDYGPHLPSGSTIAVDDVRFGTAGPFGPYSGTEPTTVYSTAQATAPLYPINQTVPLVPVANLDALTCCVTGTPTAVANGYYWDGSSTLYVYSPSVAPTSTVEIPTRMQAVYAPSHTGISISGLDLRGAKTQGIYQSGNVSNFSLTNNTIELNYGNGYENDEPTAVSTPVLIQGNLFQNNGGSGIQTNVYSGMAGWQILNNTFSTNAHILLTSGVWSNSGGVDLACANSAGPALIAYNLAHDNGADQAPPGGYLQGVGLWSDTCNNSTITKRRCLQQSRRWNHGGEESKPPPCRTTSVTTTTPARMARTLAAATIIFAPGKAPGKAGIWLQQHQLRRPSRLCLPRRYHGIGRHQQQQHLQEQRRRRFDAQLERGAGLRQQWHQWQRQHLPL